MMPSLATSLGLFVTLGMGAAVLPPAVDVVVVGAGYSGLAAARDLRAAGKRVAVFEANNYAGGRTLNFDLRSVRPEAGIVELGGEWLSDRKSQPHAWRLIIDELGFGVQLAELAPGLATAYTASTPQGVTFDPSSGKLPLHLVPPEVRKELVWFQGEMHRVFAALPANESMLDKMTLDTWMQLNLKHQGSRDLVRYLTLGGIGQEAFTMSALYPIKAWRGEPLRIATETNYRVIGGTQGPPEKMRAELGSAVHLSMPVAKIVQDARGVEVGLLSGESIRAEYIIFTGTPSTSNKVAWSPPLPSAKIHLFSYLPLGNTVKMMAFYETKFWKQRNHSGTIISSIDVNGILFPGCQDNSPLNSTIGVLLCFVMGDSSTKLMSLPKSERRAALVLYLEHTFGKQALTLFHYEDHDWALSPYIGGGVQPILAPGVLTHQYHALASDFGRVTWAGSDTRPVDSTNSGYIDGAIQSGQEAAQRVLRALEGRMADSNVTSIMML